MSLSSLKKSTQSDRPRLVTVDQFIDDAVCYAHGANSKKARQTLRVVEKAEADRQANRRAKMRRSTYTFTDQTVDALTVLAERTGISKSRLLRILVNNHMRKANDNALLDSKVR